jgi:MSHA biogenesis protein MshN
MRLTPPVREATSTTDELQRAQALLKLGRADEAEAALRALLQAQPANVAARQSLLGVLLPAKRHAEAIQILRDGLRLQPDQLTWSMNLARLLVDGQDYTTAWEVLAAVRPHAADNADYYAFAGTVLQRLGRAAEAVGQFDTALRLRPREARWWVGFGIALENAGRGREALEAFSRAKGLGGLSPEVQAYVEDKLR